MGGKTERVEARLSSSERDRIHRAAAYEGQSLSSFIVSAAVDRADAILAAHTVTSMPSDYFDRLLAALDEPERASGLQRAAALARQRRRIA